jgi:hypothetical protein
MPIQLHAFFAELMLGFIHTHPHVVYGDIVCKNPYYIPPDGFLKQNQASREVERLLHNILTWERAQQAVRANEDHLRLVIDTVPALIHAGRPDRYLDFSINVGWTTSVFSLEEMSGWKWAAVNHPEHVAATVEKWRTAVATGAFLNMKHAFGERMGNIAGCFTQSAPARRSRKHR